MGQVFGNPSHKQSQTGFETAVWAVKAVLLTVGVVSSVIIVKVYVIPSVSSFAVSSVPCLRSFFRRLLSPPYIYILLNFIILTIVASSAFQQRSSQYPFKKPQKPSEAVYRSIDESPEDDQFQFEFPRREDSLELAVAAPTSDDIEPGNQAMEHLNYMEEDSHPGSSLDGMPGLVSREGSADVKEMIIEGARPENPEKPGKPEEPNDSLDSIWKSIMESQGKQPLPEIKKSGTWDSPIMPTHPAEPEPETSLARDSPAAVWARREMRKSDTFKERSSPSSKLGKHLSQDDLNLRAEAFIRQFNLDMRLQREESELRRTGMVN